MSEQRKNKRYSTFGLTTPYGQITNISDTGLCIFRKGKQELGFGEMLRLVVQHEQAEVVLEGVVIRVQEIGMFRHEIGIEFTEVDAEKLAEIRLLIELGQAESVSPSCFLAA
ncbi:MAG: PilZ domain-containing protein [Phycisphaerales bacterium JB063]